MTGTDLQTTRLLIVDDNTSVHEQFRMILSSPTPTQADLEALERALFSTQPRDVPAFSFRIDSAFQGEEAVDMVVVAHKEERPYTLAFVDVRMPPGLDGIETVSRIWRADPRVQAVICTAYSDHTWSDIARSLGHSDSLLVLRKPFDPIEALQLAHALTRKWHLARDVENRLRALSSALEARTCELTGSSPQLEAAHTLAPLTATEGRS